MAYLPTTFKSVENKQYKSGELPADGVTAPALTEKGTYRVLMKYMTPQNNITINTRGLEFDLNLGRFDAIFRSMAPGYGQNGSITVIPIMKKAPKIRPKLLMWGFMKPLCGKIIQKEWRRLSG